MPCVEHCSARLDNPNAWSQSMTTVTSRYNVPAHEERDPLALVEEVPELQTPSHTRNSREVFSFGVVK